MQIPGFVCLLSYFSCRGSSCFEVAYGTKIAAGAEFAAGAQVDGGAEVAAGAMVAVVAAS